MKRTYIPSEDPIKVTVEPVEGSWKRAMNLARRTAGQHEVDKAPSDKFTYEVLLPEHSPIRAVEFLIHS